MEFQGNEEGQSSAYISHKTSPISILLGIVAVAAIGGFACQGAEAGSSNDKPIAVQLSKEELAERTADSKVRLKNLNMCFTLYSTDFDDFFPLVKGWNKGIEPYQKTPEDLKDPLLKDQVEQRGFGFNAAHAGNSWMYLIERDRTVFLGLTTTPGIDAVLTKDTVRSIPGISPEKTLLTGMEGGVTELSVEEAKKWNWTPKWDPADIPKPL